MSNYGDATNLDNNNFHTLSSSLMINGGALCGIYLGFSLLRRIFDSIYSPRCQLAKMNKRFKRLPKDYMSLLSWLSPKVIIPSPSNPHEYVQLKGKVARREIINRTSLDTYMFLRMMKMLFSLFSLLCILSVGVLLPINYFGGNGKTGVDRFTMNNIKPGSKLLWAHVIYAMLFIMAMLGCIMSELSRYIRERRKYLRRVKDKTKSTTLLISTIPKGYNRQRELRNIFSNFRDGVADIYINMDLSRLHEVVKQQKHYQEKLEEKLTDYIIKCSKWHKKNASKQQVTQPDSETEAKRTSPGTSPSGKDDSGGEDMNKEKAPKLQSVDEMMESIHEDLKELKKYNKRYRIMKHRFIAQKREEIEEYYQSLVKDSSEADVVGDGRSSSGDGGSSKMANEDDSMEEHDFITGFWNVSKECVKRFVKLGKLCSHHEDGGDGNVKFKARRSAFIQFRDQSSAHMAAQSLLHDKPFAMEPKVLEIEQKDIIWENLDIRSWNRSIRFVISMILTLVLFVSWMSLTMAATSMSNLEKVIIFFGGNPNSISQTAYGVINGMVPPTITALLMMLLPILLRQLLFIEGQMLESEVEMSLLNRYYVFLVINVFIGSMISNGVLDFLRKSGSLSMWNKVMTSTIPSAYIYFSTYILLQGWLGSSKEILQGTTFFLRYLRFWWSGGTPRAKREARELEQFEWSTNIPNHMLVFLIGTTYSVLAPVVNVFAATYFGLYYLVYHHQFLYVYDHRKFSTGGLTFPRAIVQMFFGIYVFEVVFLVQIISVSVQNWLSTLRILVVVLIIFGTVLTNIVTVKAYFPLTKYLPVSEFGNINQGRRRKARKRDKLAALLFKKSRRNRAGDGDTVSLVNKGSDSDSSDNDYSSDEAATNTTAGKNTLGAHPANEYEWEQNIKDGYYHPDLKLDDKVELWLPEDKYGLREKIVQHMLAHDGEYITFKLEGAVLDEKSRIKVVL